jgi:two-component system, OmpR family, phosphate regulon sensor histidine kinase PhoR
VTAAADEIIRAFPHAAILTAGGDVVTAFNGPALALFPYLRQGEPLSFAIRDPQILDAVGSAFRDGGPRRLEIIERLPVERAFAVSIMRAGPGGALVVFDDLTAGRRLERMRVDFVANASHELRTPLASLLGFVETLKGPARNDPEARDNFLGIMEAQAKRMARLIDDLLSLSRIELNAHQRPQGIVDLAAAVRHIADALRPLAEEKGVTLDLVFPAGETAVPGERDELLRVFENLIENAIKYGHAGKRVEVTVAHDGEGRVATTVRDFGPGVAPEHLPRLTERFYRVNVAASRDAGGTGLGLAIVKHIVARHRGRLEIESEPGKGSAFRVVLEAATPAP